MNDTRFSHPTASRRGFLGVAGSALAGTGNGEANAINGTAGNNTLDGGAGDDVDDLRFAFPILIEMCHFVIILTSNY